MRSYLLFFILIINILIPKKSNSQIPSDGLVGYWPFNGNPNDESGGGNNGTAYGTTLTTDRFGNTSSAYSFDGNNDYVVVPDNNSLDFDLDEDFTVSIWVKPAVNQNFTTWDQNAILEKWTSNSNMPYPYSCLLYTSPSPRDA